ncbi:recombinase family protein [Mycobacterium sp. Root265]|uniref:recombinase family protein n=1 Tax=Mycobacterium sp. Root265 TaxID=1736504 RepID=UPI000B1BED07|nr:recombinase family protein [Mycobacterium sp. Root265]
MEIITNWADANDHKVVGWAEDVDVSGSIDPFDTPRFGDWLNNRAPEFDVIATWKLDRLSRNSIKLNKLFGWCIDHDKTVVSCSEAIDLGTPVGRLIANVIAFLAEGELEAMRERQLSSRRKLRETARWPGGKPPYGYKVVEAAEGYGKVLAIDPLAHKVVRRIVDSVLDGESVAKVCNELNADGVVSPADYYRVCAGQEDTGSPWRTWPMKHMLTSPTLVGHVHLGGVTVRDDKGAPVLMCSEPLVTDEERELIIAELARAEGGPRERGDAGALVGVAACWFCETPLTTTRQTKKLATGTKEYGYYRCPNNCTPLLPLESAEEFAEKTLLDALGDEAVSERVWVPGDSSESELRAAVAAFDELSLTAGRMTSKTAAERLQRQLAALDAKIAELETSPVREGGYADRPTGQTYREAWEAAGDAGARREMLQRIGFGLRMGIIDGNLHAHPTKLGDRLNAKIPPS